MFYSKSTHLRAKTVIYVNIFNHHVIDSKDWYLEKA